MVTQTVRLKAILFGVLVVVVALSGCQLFDSSSNPSQEVVILDRSAFIRSGAFFSIFEFDSNEAGSYRITLRFNSAMDMDWVLYDNPTRAEGLTDDFVVSSTSDTPLQEERSVRLNGNRRYYLAVFDYKRVGGSYTVTVVQQ